MGSLLHVQGVEESGGRIKSRGRRTESWRNGRRYHGLLWLRQLHVIGWGSVMLLMLQGCLGTSSGVLDQSAVEVEEKEDLLEESASLQHHSVASRDGNADSYGEEDEVEREFLERTREEKRQRQRYCKQVVTDIRSGLQDHYAIQGHFTWDVAFSARVMHTWFQGLDPWGWVFTPGDKRAFVASMTPTLIQNQLTAQNCEAIWRLSQLLVQRLLWVRPEILRSIAEGAVQEWSLRADADNAGISSVEDEGSVDRGRVRQGVLDHGRDLLQRYARKDSDEIATLLQKKYALVFAPKGQELQRAHHAFLQAFFSSLDKVSSYPLFPGRADADELGAERAHQGEVFSQWLTLRPAQGDGQGCGQLGVCSRDRIVSVRFPGRKVFRQVTSDNGKRFLGELMESRKHPGVDMSIGMMVPSEDNIFEYRYEERSWPVAGHRPQARLYALQNHSREQKVHVGVLEIPDLYDRGSAKNSVANDLLWLIYQMRMDHDVESWIIDLRHIADDASLDEAVNVFSLFVSSQPSPGYVQTATGSREITAPTSPPTVTAPVLVRVRAEHDTVVHWFVRNMQLQERAVIVSEASHITAPGWLLQWPQQQQQKQMKRSFYQVPLAALYTADGQALSCEEGTAVDVWWAPVHGQQQTLDAGYDSPLCYRSKGPVQELLQESGGAVSGLEERENKKIVLAKLNERLRRYRTLTPEITAEELLPQLALDHVHLLRGERSEDYSMLASVPVRQWSFHPIRSHHSAEHHLEQSSEHSSESESSDFVLTLESQPQPQPQSPTSSDGLGYASMQEHQEHAAMDNGEEELEGDLASNAPDAHRRYRLSLQDHVLHASSASALPEYFYKVQVCEITGEQEHCGNALRDENGEEYLIPARIIQQYSYEEARKDEKEMHINDRIAMEERRLFLKSFGMGIIGGGVSGGTLVNGKTIATVAGVTVMDSSMDAVAGVPGVVDRNVGVPKVVGITSFGTFLGTSVSLLTTVGARVLLKSLKRQSLKFVVAGILLVTGVKLAFLSDVEKVAQQKFHPLSWVKKLIWGPGTKEFATSWVAWTKESRSVMLSKDQVYSMLTVFETFLYDREDFNVEPIGYYCLPQQNCTTSYVDIVPSM